MIDVIINDSSKRIQYQLHASLVIEILDPCCWVGARTDGAVCKLGVVSKDRNLLKL